MGFAKPIDVGTGRVCASYLPDGSWLSVGAVHPVHGIVELSGMPPFDERHRGDPAAARRYRELMASPNSAFLRFEGAAVADIVAEAPPGADWIRLVARASGGSLRFDGRLDRPALAEITETHPPAPTGARTQLEAEGSVLRVTARELPASAVVEADRGTWYVTDAGGAVLHLPETTDAGPIGVTVRLSSPHGGPSPAGADRHVVARAAAGASAERSLVVPDRLEAAVERITSGAIAYVRGCTALVAGPGLRTILTDHRLLPLSWTRDAYWQALLLLVADEAGLVDDGAAIVDDHLRWLWLHTERPDSTWVRSHHANGRRKDLPFQADQQLYPLLELADYARLTGRLPALGAADTADRGRWADLIRQAWGSVEASRDPRTGLMHSDENASDDPAPLPLIGPSQILGWYTARRLVGLDASFGLGLDAEALESFATAMVRGLAQHMEVDAADGRMWAYAVDGRGESTSFHDAGDLPTAMAPLWGFCGADDATWLATMRFACSPANPGYAGGPFGGLGSPHTPGGWPLGDLQEWLFASLAGEWQHAERLLERITLVAADDGMLPEAYSAADGSFAARHWFAWPGAFLGMLWILDRRGALHETLRTPPG